MRIVYLFDQNLRVELPSFCLSDRAKRNFMDRYEQALEPFTKGRGIDWEVQIEECDVSLRQF